MKNIKIILAVIIIAFTVTISKAQTVFPIDSIPESFKTSLNKMMDGYLKIENALMQGNTTDAGKFADSLNKFTNSISAIGLTNEQLKIFNKQSGKILLNTEHIRDNPTDYDHQCEHFDIITDAFYKLLKTFKFNSTTIYYNYTANGNAGNSAHWLTEKSTLEDPYFKGKKESIGDKQIEILQPKL